MMGGPIVLATLCEEKDKFIVKNGQSYELFSNNCSTSATEFQIFAFVDCNIVDIDDETIHIHLTKYTDGVYPTFKTGILRNAEITHFQKAPTDEEQIIIWESIKEPDLEKSEYFYLFSDPEQQNPEEQQNHNDICALKKTYFTNFDTREMIQNNKNFTNLFMGFAQLSVAHKNISKKDISHIKDGYKCEWADNNNKYELIHLNSICYMLIKNNILIQGINALDYDLREGDCGTYIFLMNGHILVWNDGDACSVILFKKIL